MQAFLVSLFALHAPMLALARTPMPTSILVQPISSPLSMGPQPTQHVAVGRSGNKLFQPNKVEAAPGTLIVFDCYKDNLSLLKATLNFRPDDVPSTLICQKDSHVSLQVTDGEPHIFYSPNIPAAMRYKMNMVFALNAGAQLSQILGSGLFPTATSSTSGQHLVPTGRVSRGTGTPGAHTVLPTGISGSTHPTISPSWTRFTTATIHVPIAPTSVPATNDGKQAKFEAWILTVLALLSLFWFL